VEGYFWDFGDGTKISDSVPDMVHFFQTAGHYSVTLIVKNKLGCSDTLTKNLFIEVDGPTAKFGTLQPGTCINNSLTFIDSSSTDGTHTLTQWTWDYGDGTIETVTSPPFQHTYNAAGTYSVSLVVVDNKGCSDKIVKTNSVIISKPLASFSSPDTLTCSGKPIQFNDLSAGPGLTYLWKFGDSTTSNDANPLHQYTSQGIYTVGLTVTDKFGCTASAEKLNYINVSNPKAGFLMSDSISTCPPLVVTFTNTSKNSIDYTWDFGDGTTSLLKDPTHFYSTPGTFRASLRITGPGGCIDEISKNIVVKGPSGSFTYTNITGCNPLQTNFKGTTTRNISFVWDFNDGTTVTTKDSLINHTYTNPGNYLPKMILVDVNGCRVPIIGIDTIRVFGINAAFDISQRTLCDSGSVQFTGKSITNDLVTSYLWDFGDGTSSSVKDPTHTFSTTGSFITKLVVKTSSGCTDTASLSTPVKIIASPKIGIGGGNSSCIPATLNFTGQVLAPDTSILTWKWDMANGNMYTQKDPPTQQYTIANTYTIKATATNSTGCSNTATKVIEAYPLPDIRTNADLWICKGKSITLNASGGVSYTWSPSGSLSCSTCASPDAKPDTATKYFVTGTSVNGCINKDSILLSVKSPFKMQVSPSVSLCRGRSTIMSASGTDRYVWTPSLGLNNALIAEPKASPYESTNYRVIGTDDLGCFSDTGYVSVKVYAIPTVNAGEDKTINVGQTIDLVPEISADVTGVNWSPTSGVFRNNYPGIAARPVESTEYTVEVVNEGGCRARDMITVYVLCNNANVFIPNTFSPNRDGVNDIFYPRGSGLFTIKMMRIFNRWGDVVFEKGNMSPNNASMGWDGTFKGQQLTPDVFVYLIDIVCDNNTVLTYKGNIALIK
jgi:gliding motility-associated-like protein